jgi:hypothetical protein
MNGVIVKYFPKPKSFGFIESNGVQFFFHETRIISGKPRIGAKCRFDVWPTTQRLWWAINIQIEESSRIERDGLTTLAGKSNSV